MADEQNDAMKGRQKDAKAQPSGPKADSPATAGHGDTKVKTDVAEKSKERLNPSSPGNTGTTPGTVDPLG